MLTEPFIFAPLEEGSCQSGRDQVCTFDAHPMLALTAASHAYTRWGCPKARSEASNIKAPPCGAQVGNFSDDEVMEISPGPLTVRFEEAIASAGSPFRIALTGDSDDTELCTLLDHIPHDDTVRTACTCLPESCALRHCCCMAGAASMAKTRARGAEQSELLGPAHLPAVRDHNRHTRCFLQASVSDSNMPYRSTSRICHATCWPLLSQRSDLTSASQVEDI